MLTEPFSLNTKKLPYEVFAIEIDIVVCGDSALDHCLWPALRELWKSPTGVDIIGDHSKYGQ